MLGCNTSKCSSTPYRYGTNGISRGVANTYRSTSEYFLSNNDFSNDDDDDDNGNDDDGAEMDISKAERACLILLCARASGYEVIVQKPLECTDGRDFLKTQCSTTISNSS